KTERHLRQRKLYSSLKKEPTWRKKNNSEEKIQKFFAIPEENGINSKTSITLKSIKSISSSSLSEIPDTGIGKLEIYVDGPYGAPAEHFFEAEHAVLISSGIGVTPFASILQTIMLRYKSASHSCPNCEHSWVGNVPFSLRKLQK
ncbi:NADPH oxidase 5, partial [Paramuricea clavata]